MATGDVQVPQIAGNGLLTAERLAELRNVLAALADSPIATLEVHPLPDKSRPLPGHTARRREPSRPAPLAAHRQDRELILDHGGNSRRRVIPDDRSGEGGLPVRRGAGAAATGAAALGGTAALTVAAPLVLMAVVVGVSAYADYKRQQANQHITELLEKLHEDKLEAERGELEGCREAIDKATVILLDQGKLGVSLGLDSAVHAISKALAAADRRLQRWNDALAKMADNKPVELGTLTSTFPGVDEQGGTFRAHLELAALAIALKRRVIILQAVEHAQMDSGNPFENFVRALKADQQRLDQLESGIASVLRRVSALELTRPHRLQDFVFTPRDVDRLLRASHRIHELGNGVEVNDRVSDVPNRSPTS